MASASKTQGQEYILLSWSRASIFSTEIQFHDHPNRELVITSHFLMEILDTHSVLKRGNPLGQLEEGCYLRVRGPLCRADIQFKPERQHCDSCDSHDQYEFEVTFPGLGVFRGVRFRPGVTFQGLPSGTKIDNLYCLPVRNNVHTRENDGIPKISDTWKNGLVLQPVEDGEMALFRRWGMFTVSLSGDLGYGFGGLEAAFKEFDKERVESRLLYYEDGEVGFEYELKII